MLISWSRLLTSRFVRGFYPVPSSISMSSQPPRVCKTALIGCSSAKTHHHAGCTSSWAKGCRVIDSSGWLFFTAINLDPWKWCFFYTETPDIIDRLLTCVAAKYKKVRFWKYDWMSVPSAWSWANNGNYHPLSHFFTVSHVKQEQVICCQTAT